MRINVKNHNQEYILAVLLIRNNYLFWMDTSNSGANILYRSWLNGSQVTTLVTTDIGCSGWHSIAIIILRVFRYLSYIVCMQRVCHGTGLAKRSTGLMIAKMKLKYMILLEHIARYLLQLEVTLMLSRLIL